MELKYYRKERLDRIDIAAEKQGRISTLQSNGQTLEKLFDFQGRGYSLARSALSRHHFELFDGTRIPAPECLTMGSK